jgi:hypothetical protein
MFRELSWVTVWRGPVDVELDGTLRSSVASALKRVEQGCTKGNELNVDGDGGGG